MLREERIYVTFSDTLTLQIQKMENQKRRRSLGEIIMRVYQMIETL